MKSWKGLSGFYRALKDFVGFFAERVKLESKFLKVRTIPT